MILNELGHDLETMVSIIIPVYNCEKYLASAIQSALDQTYENKEIIVVDDGSTDRTKEIILEFKGINQIFKTNGGTASALNSAIKNSKGKWIKWLSADDVLYKEAISEMMKKVLDKNTIYYTHYDCIDESGKVTSEFMEHDRPESELWNYYYSNGSTWLFHRDLIERTGLFDESLKHSEDYEFLLRTTQIFGCNLQLIPIKSLKYRRHPDQLTRKVGGAFNSLIKNKIRKLMKVNLLLARCSPRSDIQQVESENINLPCDKLIARYYFEYEAYKTVRNFFLKQKDYTHLVLATDDIVVKPEHIIQLQKDLEDHDYPIICGMMNVNQDEYLQLDGNLNISYELGLKDRKLRHYNWIKRKDLPKDDIFSVKFNGFALMAIHRDIIQRTEFPCDGIFRLKGEAFGASVDFVFCWWCHENNIPIYTDKRIDMQHLRAMGRIKHGEITKNLYFIPKEAKEETKLDKKLFE